MFYAIFGYNRCYKIIGFKRGRVESGCELMIYDEKRTGGAGMVEKEEFYLNSTNGVNKLHVILWHPLEETGRLFRFPMACVNMWIVMTVG